MWRLFGWLFRLVAKAFFRLVRILWSILKFMMQVMLFALASLWTGIPTALERTGRAAVERSRGIRLTPSMEKIVYCVACAVAFFTILLGWFFIAHLTILLFWQVF